MTVEFSGIDDELPRLQRYDGMWRCYDVHALEYILRPSKYLWI